MDEESGLAQRRRVADLLRDLDRFRLGMGLGEHSDRIDAMTAGAASCRNRADRLRRRADELVAEARSLEEEAYGRERITEAFLIDLVGQLAEGMCSPTPVVGFRMWEVVSGRMTGVRTMWPEPTMVATCARGSLGVPHSDGRCGRLGCGVYAGKDVRRLLHRPPLGVSPGSTAAKRAPSVAVGLVELTGKVVEHELGYRGEKATVVAIAVSHRGRTLATADPAEIATLFRDVPATVERLGDRSVTPLADLAIEYLILQQQGEPSGSKETTAWTSEDSSA